tara:strand:- start:21 stop:563 length:543 start_codon:yes stop_codon:yes gene_type:complete
MMIYLPKRAVFIHIPRTGGHSIKNAIARSCIGQNIPMVVSTMPPHLKQFERVHIHQTASTLRGYIREWNDIYRFAVHRPMDERIESIIKWVEHLKQEGFHEQEYVADEVKEFVGRDDYKEWIIENWKHHTTKFFTEGVYGEDLGVEVYNFEDLGSRWYEICDKCNIPRCELPELNGIQTI